MGTTVKNRVIASFDKEKMLPLKVKFATLEQAVIFRYYVQKCVNMTYSKVDREVMTEDGWAVAESRVFTNEPSFLEKRIARSPFKLELCVFATESHAEFVLEFYMFDGADLDHLAMLLEQGLSAKEISITGYRRDRETKEWRPREFNKLVPSELANLFSRLSTKDRADAIAYIRKMEAMR